MKTKEIKIHSTRPERQGQDIKTRAYSHLSASLLATLFVFFLCQFDLFSLKGLLIDGLMRAHWGNTPHPAIKLIAYDDESSARYEGETKIPPVEMEKVFSSLSKENPLAVVLLTQLNESNYSEAELLLFSKAFSKVKNAFVGYIDDESLGKNPPTALMHNARYLPGFVSRDTFSFGADSVTRRVLVNIDGSPTVYSRVADLYNGTKETSVKKDSSYQGYFKVGDTVQAYINWQGPANTYPIYSSASVANSSFAPGVFNNKIVIISSSLMSRKDKDFILTPFSREHFQTTLLEGAANSLATLLNNNTFVRSSYLMSSFFALVIVLLTVNMALFLSPAKGILLVGLEILSAFILSWALLYFKGYWLDISHALISAGVGYYLVIPFRLIDEYRKRWHYQEKSELMGQLEQLKTNFLSLVSHDLKTPLARIQGNAELAIKSSDANTRKHLDSILTTTEDLNNYVETILDLTRIESAKMPLRKSSKDINATIKEVISKKEFMALEKNITIETALEPLFSIKFDPKLIEQVLSNLLENAIKYSPANTTIKLSSFEENDLIKILVADQGTGIPLEEQDKVFSKFYRGKNPNTEKEKGTGLGLYLVKYFIELHQGFVDLKSEVGKGSVFTISLPV